MWRRHPSHRGRDVELATSTQEPRDATCQHPHRRCKSDDFFVDGTMRDNSSSLSSRTCAGGADVAQAGWRLGDVGGHRPLGRSAACTSSGSGGPAGEGTLPGIKNMKTSHILDQADVSEFTLAHSWMVPQLCANHHGQADAEDTSSLSLLVLPSARPSDQRAALGAACRSERPAWVPLP